MATSSTSPPTIEVPAGVLKKPPILPSKLGHFVNLDGCPQQFQSGYDEEYAGEGRREHDYNEAFRTLNLLLEKDGNDYEEQLVDEFEQRRRPH